MKLASITESSQNNTIHIEYTFGHTLPKPVDIYNHLTDIKNLIDGIDSSSKPIIVYDCTSIPVRLNLINKKVKFLRSIQDDITQRVGACYIMVSKLPNWTTNLIEFFIKSYSTIPVHIIHDTSKLPSNLCNTNPILSVNR